MTQAIKLFGRMLSFSRLQLQTDNMADIQESLDEITANPHNDRVAVVIESDYDLNLPQLLQRIRGANLQVIGIADGVLSPQAAELQLAVLPTSKSKLAQIRSPSIQTSNIDDPNQYANPLVYNELVRSGQSISHKGGDLILTQSINSGAEAITTHSLHIYGTGQGRLVAGASGDTSARIFCQSFQPSLVSVAGTYCVFDNIPSEMIGKAVQIYFDNSDGLVFTLMNPQVQ